MPAGARSSLHPKVKLPHCNMGDSRALTLQHDALSFQGLKQ
jgi:hypothetical protein